MSILGFLGKTLGDLWSEYPIPMDAQDTGTVVVIPPYDAADLSEANFTAWMEKRVWSKLKAALNEDEVSDLMADVWAQIDRAYEPYGGYSSGAQAVVDRVIDAYYDRAVGYLQTGTDPWGKIAPIPGEMPGWARAGMWIGMVGGGIAVAHRLFTGEWLWE